MLSAAVMTTLQRLAFVSHFTPANDAVVGHIGAKKTIIQQYWSHYTKIIQLEETHLEPRFSRTLRLTINRMPRMLPHLLPHLLIRPMLPLQNPPLLINIPHPIPLRIQIPALALGHGADQAFGTGIGADSEERRNSFCAEACVPWETVGISDLRRDEARVRVDVGMFCAALVCGMCEILELNIRKREAMLCRFRDPIVSRLGEIHVVPLDSGRAGVRVLPV